MRMPARQRDHMSPPSIPAAPFLDDRPLGAIDERRAGLRLLSGTILFSASLIFLGNVYRHQALQWDDAYITFRFAQHLVDGHGLTWNVGGARVEGYSSLLELLLLALGMRIGIRPEVASIAL